MRQIIFFILFFTVAFLPAPLSAQRRVQRDTIPHKKPTVLIGTHPISKLDATIRSGWQWSSALKKWTRVSTDAVFFPTKIQESKFETAMNGFKWAFPDSIFQGGTRILMPGHWERAAATDLTNRLALNATFSYPVDHDNLRSYPTPKPIAGAYESETNLSVDEVNNTGFLGKDGRLNIHYVKKIKMGLLTFDANQDHIVVTDTLYVKPAQMLSGIIQISSNRRSFVKIIASCIVYESPLFTSLVGPNSDGDLILSAGKIIFKSPYRLKNYQLKPNPPIVNHPQDLNLSVYKDYYYGNDAIVLMNRLFVKIMENSFTQLNSTADIWLRDKLVNQFQYYRTRIRNENSGLRNDPLYEAKFNQICKSFDEKNFRIETIRMIGTLPIIANGNIQPIKLIRYYALPTKASLLPLLSDSSQLLGTIVFKPTGDAKLKLTIDAELTYNAASFQAAKAELAQKGLILEDKLPNTLLSIAEQPLKIKGKTIGKIFPISNKIVRLEMDLPEESKTITELFPKVGSISFKIDFAIEGGTKQVSQELTLEVAPPLLSQLDYTKPLESFDILDNSNLTSTIKLTSNLDATQIEEGALNYAEILLEFQFGTKTMLRGPYRLSSYNTLASEVLIPFIKKSPTYSVTVSGRALYEDGERNVVPFTAISDVIVIDESVLKKQ